MSGFMSGMAPKTTSDFGDYKFPPGFVVGVGPVADLQYALELQYTSLSGSMNQQNDVDNFYLHADDRSNSDSVDQGKETLRGNVENTLEDIIKIMVQIMHAGADPAPPCPRVDAAVSLFLGTAPMAAQALAKFQAEVAAAGAHVVAQDGPAAGANVDA